MSDLSSFTGFFGKYSRKVVCAEQGEGGLLRCNRDEHREWEHFEFIDLDDGDNIIAIKSTHSNKYVAVEMGEHRQLTASRDWIREWEKFELNIIEPIVFGHEGKFALKSLASGQWVCAEQGEGGELRANRDWIREWEEFAFIFPGFNLDLKKPSDG